jgi:hypothetical protein
VCPKYQATALLARTDEVLALAAWANARNAFEVAVRVMWLLYPRDRFECEMRWIALIHEWERFEERMTRYTLTISETHRLRAQALRDIREGIIKEVPIGHSPVSRIPSIEQRLNEFGTAEMFSI